MEFRVERTLEGSSDGTIKIIGVAPAQPSHNRVFRFLVEDLRAI